MGLFFALFEGFADVSLSPFPWHRRLLETRTFCIRSTPRIPLFAVIGNHPSSLSHSLFFFGTMLSYIQHPLPVPPVLFSLLSMVYRTLLISANPLLYLGRLWCLRVNQSSIFSINMRLRDHFLSSLRGISAYLGENIENKIDAIKAESSLDNLIHVRKQTIVRIVTVLKSINEGRDWKIESNVISF